MSAQGDPQRKPNPWRDFWEMELKKNPDDKQAQMILKMFPDGP